MEKECRKSSEGHAYPSRHGMPVDINVKIGDEAGYVIFPSDSHAIDSENRMGKGIPDEIDPSLWNMNFQEVRLLPW